MGNHISEKTWTAPTIDKFNQVPKKKHNLKISLVFDFLFETVGNCCQSESGQQRALATIQWTMNEWWTNASMNEWMHKWMNEGMVPGPGEP